jgi:hypothetical protein
MALGRWTSRVLQLIGIVGLLVCVALAVAILAGRAWVGVAVGDAFTTVDTTIADGLASIDDATTRLGAGVGALDELLGQIGTLPASSPIPAAVAARVSQVLDSYTPARDRYVEARSKAQAALDYLELSGRLTPGVEVPPGVAAALATVDDRLATIDTALVGLRGAARATAGDVATAATSLREAIAAATDAGGNLRTQVDGLRLRIADVHTGIDRVLWLGAGAVLAIVGYVGLLNVIVIWLARRRPKSPAGEVERAAIEAGAGQ